MDSTAICNSRAVDLARLIRTREISAREVTLAHIEQIERVDPTVNAIVTFLPERALAAADALDTRIGAGEADALGPLAGLPIAHKDLVPTAGIRTTYGSPIYADNVPNEDGLIVERLRAAGAITIGKTNVPEFGAGSHTFNPVFGATRNPWDLSRTCGGSSGGAAVALACRMLPIADGSDFGGSLRNPGNFNNVVGFRTSPGRVPVYPTPTAWLPFSVQGPMARTVEDAALMLSAIAGPDPRSPIAIDEPPECFAAPLERDFTNTRIAYSADLGGLPVDPEVRKVIGTVPAILADLGCIVEAGEPDFTGADVAFNTWRAWRMQLVYGELVAADRARVKETVVWNVEVGETLSGPQIGAAEATRTAIYHRVREFMERYEYLVLPVNQVPPFPIEVEYPTEIDGVPMESYIDWMRSCSWITVTGLPAISVPCGFTSDGLPVGVQIVGRHHHDFGVLQLAWAFQEATAFWRHTPPAMDGDGRR